MAMILQQTRLRVTQAIYYGKPPGGGGGTVTAVGGGNGITATPGPIVAAGNLDLGPLTSSWDAGNFLVNAQNTGRVFNVRAYGAVGNSVTDDIVAIQAATDAAKAVKGVVYFPRSAGYYRVSTPILVEDATGIGFLGEGTVGSQIAATAGSPAITVLNIFSNVSSGTVHDVVVKDLGITAGATGIALRIWNCLHFSLENVYTAGGAPSLSIQGSGAGVLDNVQAWSGASIGNGGGAVTNSGPIVASSCHFVTSASATPALVMTGDLLAVSFHTSQFQSVGGTHASTVQIDGGASGVGSVDFYDCHGESNYNTTNTGVDFLIGNTTKAGHVGIHGGNFWGHGNVANYQATWLKVVAAKDIVAEDVIVSKLGNPNGYNTAMVRLEATFPAAGDTYRFSNLQKTDISGALYSDANGFISATYAGAASTPAQFSGGTTSAAEVIRVTSSATVGPIIRLDNEDVTSNYSALFFAARATDRWALIADPAASGAQSLGFVDQVNANNPIRILGNASGGYVGFGGATTPTRTIDVNGTQRYRGIAAPAVSEANSGTLYFDSALNKYRVSMNGSAYVDLVGSAGLTGSGVVNKLAYWSGATSLTQESNVTLGGTYTLDVNGDINITSSANLYRINALRALSLDQINGIVTVGTGTVAAPGVSSTLVGWASGTNVTGAGVTLVGTQAGQNTTGNGATAVGAGALLANTSGAENTAVGSLAGDTNTTGSNNVCLGSQADVSAGNLTNAVAIGYQAVVGASDSMSLGNASMKVGIHTSTPAAPLDVDGAVATRHKNIALANGLNSDIALTDASFIRITGPTGAFSLGGFTGGVDGRLLRIINTTAQAMTIVNLDGASAAANRITTLTGGNVVLAARTTAATFVYEDVSDTWLLFSWNG